jgi:pimeloyl-ACP methyl ester carboxylesterase
MRRSPSRAVRGLLLALLASALGAVMAAPAAADDFYTPPATLPAHNGDIVRSEPSTFYLDPLRTIRAPATVQRIMYRSTDAHGEPMAVTGTVLTPSKPWLGRGQRPVVGFAVGTQGLGDQCAPSRQLAAGSEYEGSFIAGLLQRGYGVAVSDYQGLGTPGVHTYVVRAATGHAVLDAVRAAQRLDAAGLPDAGPVALAGYSQGGGGSASAAELEPTYAPELDLKGAYAGAVPAELAAVARFLDGGPYAGFMLYAVNGLDEAYPELDAPGLLNAAGDAAFSASQSQCTVETVARYAFTRSSSLTTTGESISSVLQREPYRSVVAEQRIGDRRPAAPALVIHSVADDVVPYGQGRDMARSWCAKGVGVRFDTSVAPTHVGAAVAAFPVAFGWLEARFAGLPAPGNCGWF